MLIRKIKTNRVAAWTTGGALLLGSCYVVSAEETAWEKVKETVSDVVGADGYNIKLIEGQVVNLGDQIVLTEQQRESMGNRPMFAQGPVGIRTDGGDLYLILPDRFKDVQLDRLSFQHDADAANDGRVNDGRMEHQQQPPRATDTREAGERETRGPQLYDTKTNATDQAKAAATDQAKTDVAMADQEQKLREATADARAKLDSTRYETQVTSLDSARVGQHVAVIGRIYSNGGLQAILTDSIHADEDGPATQALAD